MKELNQVLDPKTKDGRSYFLHLKEGDMPGYVIVPGSPERIQKIIANWDNVQDVAENRHYISKRGTFHGMEQGATSTGIGALSAEIENNKGSTLPETGGMGTTIFYVLGSVLVIGAAVLLITKKRMGASK